MFITVPNRLWTSELEKLPMKDWHGVLQSSRGHLLTKAVILRAELNEASEMEKTWDAMFTGLQILNNMLS